jgi:hypothetical protein
MLIFLVISPLPLKFRALSTPWVIALLKLSGLTALSKRIIRPLSISLRE